MKYNETFERNALLLLKTGTYSINVEKQFIYISDMMGGDYIDCNCVQNNIKGWKTAIDVLLGLFIQRMTRQAA